MVAIRHFTRLSTWNYAIDHGMYPLGSCTMKYNPRVNELVARTEGLAWSHPYQPESLSQRPTKITRIKLGARDTQTRCQRTVGNFTANATNWQPRL